MRFMLFYFTFSFFESYDYYDSPNCNDLSDPKNSASGRNCDECAPFGSSYILVLCGGEA